MEYATLLNMDRQGRIVIPIQVRKALKLEEGDLLALEANEKNILLRKQTAYIPLDAGLKEFLDILHANVPSRILLCNETKVLAVKNYHAALKHAGNGNHTSTCPEGNHAVIFSAGRRLSDSFRQVSSICLFPNPR